MYQKKHKYTFSRVLEKPLYLAVQFARAMRKNGTPTDIAVCKAARYYDVSYHDVAHYLGELSNRKGYDGEE